MIEYMSNVFLAVCGVLALLGAMTERDHRFTNLLWAFFCFAIAAVGFFATSKHWQVVGGIISGLALVFFLASKIMEARSKGKKKNEPTSAGDISTRAMSEK